MAIAAAALTAGALTGWSMAYISVGQAMAVGMASGAVSGAIMTGSIQGAFQGAIFGAFSAGMAWSIGGLGVGEFAKASLHGISQGAMGMMQGGTFRSGFWSGFMSSAVSVDNVSDTVVGRTVAAGIVGGTASELGGGKFANGAMTGAFVYMFGEAASQRREQRPLKFGSKEELAAALGKNGFTTGGRALANTGGFRIDDVAGGALDVSNMEFIHEHVFYTDGNGVLHNIGFSTAGLTPDSHFPNNIGDYTFAPIQQNVVVTPSVLNPSGYTGSDYRFFTHNCQDYVSAVRGALF